MATKEKQKIYIVMTFTGTALSRLIRVCTKDEFCHVSLSLDKNLDNMYSFGRLKPYNPFIGGFVHESPKWGTFKRFKKTKARIISLEVTEYQYHKIKKMIDKINSNKEKYHFNVKGLVAVKFHKRYQQKNKFYCAEFVKYLMDQAHIDYNLPDLIKPQDFISLPSELIYQGILREYV